MIPAPGRCWVCDSEALTLVKPSDLEAMRPEDFAISDAHYGRTAAIYRCNGCGFLECADLREVIQYYEALEDAAYVDSRPERLLQARRLLRTIERLWGRPLAGARLLDVGAGSGPLVEEALARGVRAEGIEPSRWLQAHARHLGLPVHHGVLPHADVTGPFDIVALIDVIEHTPDPRGLLQQALGVLAPGGVIVVVTPDVSSLPARLMGWRWWHFRLAHVGYFSAATLAALSARLGLVTVGRTRPGWVLPLPYLIERLERYLPFRLPRVSALATVAVPFNLRDSILLVARRG
jgi:2-polyprenyl-3-methyl-5-hydroxy-6-metoxy-1,4-benzoquinol methylase